jgi:hypothetical protein
MPAAGSAPNQQTGKFLFELGYRTRPPILAKSSANSSKMAGKRQLMNRKERKEHKDKHLQTRLASHTKGRRQIMAPLVLCDLCVLCG